MAAAAVAERRRSSAGFSVLASAGTSPAATVADNGDERSDYLTQHQHHHRHHHHHHRQHYDYDVNNDSYSAAAAAAAAGIAPLQAGTLAAELSTTGGSRSVSAEQLVPERRLA